MKKLVFATNNIHKLNEIRQLLGTSIELVGLNEIGFSGEIPEEQDTLEGNALQKANFIFEKFHIPVFADDTGLEIAALNGAPGVYSARYAGNHCSPADNIVKVLSELNGVTNRKARFRCVIAFVDGARQLLFDGIVNGEIIKHGRGADGFGYDPVFLPEGYSRTFAEMPVNEKNKISHRALAFKKLKDYLLKPE